MAFQVVNAETDDQIIQVAALAESIWGEYWPQIELPAQEHVRFVSAQTITRHIADCNWHYYLLQDEGMLGFAAIRPLNNQAYEGSLYLKMSARDQGYTSSMFEFLESECAKRDMGAIWLTTFKHNRKATDVYKIKPSGTLRKETNELGSEFYYDSFIMEKDD